MLEAQKALIGTLDQLIEYLEQQPELEPLHAAEDMLAEVLEYLGEPNVCRRVRLERLIQQPDPGPALELITGRLAGAAAAVGCW